MLFVRFFLLPSSYFADSRILSLSLSSRLGIFFITAILFLALITSKSKTSSKTYIRAPSEIKVKNQKHICMLIDKCLHEIPWERLTFMDINITRMPSFRFLIAHWYTCKNKIHKEKAFYIVDPDGDSPGTI